MSFVGRLGRGEGRERSSVGYRSVLGNYVGADGRPGGKQ